MPIAAATTLLLWGYVIIPILAMIVGILVAHLPSFRKQRRRRFQVNEVILGVEAGPGIERRPSLVERLSAVEHQMTPNGGDTKQLGDTVQRIEQSLIDLTETVMQHGEQNTQAIAEIRIATRTNEEHIAEIKDILDAR